MRSITYLLGLGKRKRQKTEYHGKTYDNDPEWLGFRLYIGQLGIVKASGYRKPPFDLEEK